MKFKYRYFRQLKRHLQIHLRCQCFQVRLAYSGKQTDVVALVDTGAEDSLFDKDVAEDLGLDLKSAAEKREHFGVAGQSVIGYIHPIRLQVQGFSEWIVRCSHEC